MKHLALLKPRPGLAILLIILSLVVTACGSAYGTAPTSTGAAGGSASTAVVPVTGGATVQAANDPSKGQILVTSDGRTLYTNTVDTAQNLKCVTSECTNFWPPYTVKGRPTAGQGVTGTLGTVTRPDGSTQVTYNQQPLYTFYLDKKAGDAQGDGFTDLGGTWHVVTP